MTNKDHFDHHAAMCDVNRSMAECMGKLAGMCEDDHPAASSHMADMAEALGKAADQHDRMCEKLFPGHARRSKTNGIETLLKALEI